MRGRVRNEEKCNMDLMEKHCECTVAGRWREWVGGQRIEKKGMRGKERSDYTSSFLDLRAQRFTCRTPAL